MPLSRKKKQHKRGGRLFWKNSHKKQKASSNSRDGHFFESTSITMTDNRNSDYKPIGIVHATGLYAVGTAKSFLSGATNALGFTGFEASRYNSARRRALNKLYSELKGSDKICNLRIEMQESHSTVMAHAYGTLYSTGSRSSVARRKTNRKFK